MNEKGKKPPEGEAPNKEDTSREETEKDIFQYHDDEDEGNVSDETKYWEKYFEEEDEEIRYRDKKRVKKKGKFKDRDFE